MTDQAALTILAKIKPGARDELDATLRIVSADVENNAILPFERIGGIHFARLLILDEAKDLQGRVIRPSLAFVSNVDGSPDAYLERLVRIAGEGLDRIYVHCEGYPEAVGRTPQSRLDFLRTHRIPTQALYVNTVGRTVAQVREEAALRDALEGYLDREGTKSTGADARRVHGAIQTFVRGEPSLRETLTPVADPDPAWRIRETLRFVLTSLVLLALLPVFLLILPLWLLLLRLHEIRDARQQNIPRLSDTSSNRARIAIHEDQVVQNPFSVIGDIKPGWFRAFTLRAILWASNFAARHIYNNGDLGTIRLLGLSGITTIHFAQWIILDEGRRLLFLSNYDGSMNSYMDDFINRVAWGLNATFSNGVGYPKTRWLFLDGARDEQTYKAALQIHQIPTQAWYSGYKHLTAANIANNAQIRKGLGENLGEPEAARWLRRL